HQGLRTGWNILDPRRGDRQPAEVNRHLTGALRLEVSGLALPSPPSWTVWFSLYSGPAPARFLPNLKVELWTADQRKTTRPEFMLQHAFLRLKREDSREPTTVPGTSTNPSHRFWCPSSG